MRTIALSRLDHHQIRAGWRRAPLGLVEDTVHVEDRPEGTRGHGRVLRRLGEDGDGCSSEEQRQREPPGARAARPAGPARPQARVAFRAHSARRLTSSQFTFSMKAST